MKARRKRSPAKAMALQAKVVTAFVPAELRNLIRILNDLQTAARSDIEEEAYALADKARVMLNELNDES